MKQITYNVLKYGIVRNDETLNTKPLQDLIDRVSNAGGGLIVFPKGKYVLSTVYLKNNISIKLSKGAELLGSLNFYDFDKDEDVDYPLYQDQSHSFFHCSMIVAEHVSNIKILGPGRIDMRSVWDEDNVRGLVHRGCKPIALKECSNVVIDGIGVYNATDLAIYFAGCENVVVKNIKMRTYIDGISPDCSKHVLIDNCNIETGDDGIVLKSSYTLNKLEICDDIEVSNCIVKSRCNAIKFGTESNGGFKNIKVHDLFLRDSRITGISVETVDGAAIENVSFNSITMENCGAPLFVHIGQRMRGPKNLTIGSIKNLSFVNITAKGPYKVSDIIEWNYVSFKAGEKKQFPGIFSKDKEEPTGTWQITSNMCGLKDHPIENLSLKNIYLELDGGVSDYNLEVPDKAPEYPEVHVYGRILPCYGIYFRHINGLSIENVRFKLLNKDARPPFGMEDVSLIN